VARKGGGKGEPQVEKEEEEEEEEARTTSLWPPGERVFGIGGILLSVVRAMPLTR
jgi:hypothetical protein